MKKIVHLCPDANFISDSSKVFEHYYPNDNQFIVFTRDNSQQVVDRTLDNCIFVDSKENFSWVSSVIGKDVLYIFLHGIHSVYYQVLSFAKKNGLIQQCKVFWIFWGYELYDTLSYLGRCSYIDKSNPLIFKIISPSRFSFYIHLLKGNKLTASIFNDILKEIDYFCFWSKCDYDLFQLYFPCKIKFKKFSYGALWSRDESDNKLPLKDSSRVMINHQASKTGNHYSMFRLLKEIDKNNELNKIVPLSYGNLLVRRIILNKGRKMFKDRFIPIVEYLSSKKYFDYVGTCASAIFGQKRQMAAGNIQVLLSLGVKVFLRDENTLYTFYKNKGYYIYSVERDLNSLDDLLPLSTDKQLHNMRCAKANQLLFDDFMPYLFKE